MVPYWIYLNHQPTDQPTTNTDQRIPTGKQPITNQLQRPPSNRPPTNKKFEAQKKIKSIFYINHDFEKIKHRVLVIILCIMYTRLMRFLTISFYPFFSKQASMEKLFWKMIQRA